MNECQCQRVNGEEGSGEGTTTQKQGQKRPEGVFHFEMCNAQALTQSLTQDESELGAATTASWLLRVPRSGIRSNVMRCRCCEVLIKGESRRKTQERY